MAANLYDHLIKPLGIKPQETGVSREKYSAANSGPETSHGVWIDGKNGLEGIDLSFAWEYHDGLGEWYHDTSPRVHPYPVVMFFVGLDTAAINYLGADIECCLGEAMEPHSFSEPTVVVVPTGVSYGPVTTRRMYSPRGFACYVAALAPSHRSDPASGKGTDSGGQSDYSRLVKPLKDNIIIQRKQFTAKRSEYGRQPAAGESGMILGPGNADHLAWMYGEDLEGLEVNLDWGFFSSPGLWHRGLSTHTHSVDEILVFVGTDPSRSDSLGAEIEIDLGSEHERHLVTEPSIIVCPAGLPHGPFVTNWVDKPFAFFSINLSGKPEMTWDD